MTALILALVLTQSPARLPARPPAGAAAPVSMGSLKLEQLTGEYAFQKHDTLKLFSTLDVLQFDAPGPGVVRLEVTGVVFTDRDFSLGQCMVSGWASTTLIADPLLRTPGQALLSHAPEQPRVEQRYDPIVFDELLTVDRAGPTRLYFSLRGFGCKRIVPMGARATLTWAPRALALTHESAPAPTPELQRSLVERLGP